MQCVEMQWSADTPAPRCSTKPTPSNTSVQLPCRYIVDTYEYASEEQESCKCKRKHQVRCMLPEGYCWWEWSSLLYGEMWLDAPLLCRSLLHPVPRTVKWVSWQISLLITCSQQANNVTVKELKVTIKNLTEEVTELSSAIQWLETRKQPQSATTPSSSGSPFPGPPSTSSWMTIGKRRSRRNGKWKPTYRLWIYIDSG